MNLNMKWVIIGAVAVMLLVFFGRNPIEEARQKRAESMKGEDPLMSAIEEHNKKGGRSSLRSSQGLGGGGSVSSGDTGEAPLYPSYMMQNGRELRANPQRGYQPKTQLPSAPADSYYPPPPNTDPAGPRSSNEFILPGGKRVVYEGPEVFTFDAQGRRIPMPDGVYPVAEGVAMTMTIQGGKKVIIVN